MLDAQNEQAEIQRRLVSAIISGDRSAIADAQTDLVYPERLSAHVDGYPEFYEDTLVNFFPRLSELIEDDLEMVIAEFCRTGNTSHYDLGKVVRSFGDFFQKHPRVRAYPFLIDLAQFEVYEHEVYHSSPPVAVAIPGLVNDLVAGTAQLALQGHVRIQIAKYDLASYLNDQPKIADLEELERYRQVSELLIFQENWAAHHSAMSRSESIFLKHLVEDSLATACEAVSEQFPETSDLSPVLLKWLQRGLLKRAEQ